MNSVSFLVCQHVVKARDFSFLRFIVLLNCCY